MLNLTEREEKILHYWEEGRTLEKVREKNKNGKKFYFLDGPPYVTGALASHHIWVVTTKDIVLRYRRYRGYNVHDRAGFDVHGLPIENKVERKLEIKSKDDIENKIGVANFVNECRKYAEEQVGIASKMFMRYGYSADFKTVYIPYKTEYISKGWSILKSMHTKGLLYSDLQPLGYCPHCETVLSSQGPEIEYEDENDVSIFVKLMVNAKSSRLELGKNTFLIIWTTTPWTLPANMAIAANPKATYVLADFEGESYILAKDRLDSFATATGKSAIVKREFTGTELEGLSYTSPLEDKVPIQKTFTKYHKVLMSEGLVSTTEGTGLVHIAPGHGPEDYKLGKQNKIKIFSPVDVHAQYDEDAGAYKGLKVPADANKAVLADLREKGYLLFEGSVRHTYPHCWRCSSKLIFRATQQWFINVQKLKKKMISENRKIKWHPEVAQKWQENAIESSPDWCISRQRYWGTPIPIWTCSSCNNLDTIGSVEELVKRANLDGEPKDLHKPHIDNIKIKCDKCGNKMSRVPDVFDVWYDSGVSHTASLSNEEFKTLYPADWITESRDQIRGWFSMLLRTSVAVYGKRSFNEVNIGGMILDEIGREMHRHLGNSTPAVELLKISSADGYRLWNSSHPRWQELKLKKRELTEADGDVITLYNIGELVREFSEAAEFDLKRIKKPSMSKLQMEDLWILSKLNSLIDLSTSSLNNYEIDVAVNAIRIFVKEDFSRFYLKFAKQRAADAKKSDIKKIANVTAYVLYNTIILESIIAPFSTEHIYQELFSSERRSIFLENWPKSNKKLIDGELETNMEIAKDAMAAILNSREKANVPLRWPLAKATLEITNDAAYTAIQKLSGLIENYTNVKKLELKRVSGMKKEIRPAFAKLGPDFKEKAGAVANALKAVDSDALMKAIESNGSYPLGTDKGPVVIKLEHFTLHETLEEGDAAMFKYGKAYVDKVITKELKAEAFLREFERGVQMIRKDMMLKKTDRISLSYEANGEMVQILGENAKKIAKDLNSTKPSAKLEAGATSRDIDIEGEIVKVSVRKVDA